MRTNPLGLAAGEWLHETGGGGTLLQANGLFLGEAASCAVTLEYSITHYGTAPSTASPGIWVPLLSKHI